jgi:hypothetical protein
MKLMIPLSVHLTVEFDNGVHDVEGILENSQCEIFLEQADVAVLSAEITDWEIPEEDE